MITHDKLGGRSVHLLIPFDYNGKKVEQITLQPLRFGHVLLWQDGHWPNMIALMTELAGVDEALLRELRYPDADRVMEAFMATLTQEMRDDIAQGRVALKAEPEARVTNGSGAPVAMQGPGVPLPQDEVETGFDLSEEP